MKRSASVRPRAHSALLSVGIALAAVTGLTALEGARLLPLEGQATPVYGTLSEPGAASSRSKSSKSSSKSSRSTPRRSAAPVLSSSSASTIVSSSSVASSSSSVRAASSSSKSIAFMYFVRTDSNEQKTYPWQTRTMELRVNWSNGTFGTLPSDWTITYPTRTVTITACADLGVCAWMPEDLGKATVTATYQGNSFGLEYETVDVAVPLQPIPSFKDELPLWAKKSIVGMARVGVVKGYDDGSYGPADSVTKAQFAVLVQRMLAVRNGQNTAACPAHTGGPAKDHFAYGAFCLFLRNAWNLAWATDLDAPITRQDAAAILYDLSPEDDPGGYRAMLSQWQFSVLQDVSQKDDFYWAAVYSDYTGLISADNNGHFRPADGVNRAEAAVMMRRYLENVLYR